MNTIIRKIYQSTAATFALLIAMQTAQAGPMPTPDFSFGNLGPGDFSGNANLPDSTPNIAWFEFGLASTASVTLDTFNSQLEDTVMASTTPPGILMGQNDDCDTATLPANYVQSCLFFPDLSAAAYLVGVMEYSASITPPFADTAFIDLWMVDGPTEPGDPGVALNIQVREPSQPVPAPATLALFGLGLAGLGWSRRNKA